MTRSIRTLAFLGALSLAPATAYAFPAGFGGTFCGGDNFQTCAWFEATIVGNNVTLKVRNTSGSAASVFTAIGLANMGAGVTTTTWVPTNQGSSTSNFNGAPTGLSGAGIVGPVIGVGADAPPVGAENGLNNGEEVWFAFTLGGTFSLDNVQFALHDQGGTLAGCETSTKLVVSKNGTTGDWEANSPPAECIPDDEPPFVEIPEPATMVLLATGLIGLAGAQLRRRKTTKV